MCMHAGLPFMPAWLLADGLWSVITVSFVTTGLGKLTVGLLLAVVG
jgi:hypothetical protein